MLFFKRILKEPEVAVGSTSPAERRTIPRFAINPQFKLKAVLSFTKRNDTQSPKGSTRPGWNWKCRILDCSEQGVRIMMDPAFKVPARDLCDLKLSVEGFELTIPCHIANIREEAGGVLFGLKHDIEAEKTWNAYWQLLEVVALGSSLKLHRRTTRPDESGYLVEQYVNNRPAHLTIWRHPADKSVAAFEFRLKDNLVRAAAGQQLACLTGAAARPATAAQALEIQRLFQWVVLNLSSAVPDDVREFLKRYAS
jgi:hypothetical protein